MTSVTAPKLSVSSHAIILAQATSLPQQEETIPVKEFLSILDGKINGMEEIVKAMESSGHPKAPDARVKLEAAEGIEQRVKENMKTTIRKETAKSILQNIITLEREIQTLSEEAGTPITKPSSSATPLTAPPSISSGLPRVLTAPDTKLIGELSDPSPTARRKAVEALGGMPLVPNKEGVVKKLVAIAQSDPGDPSLTVSGLNLSIRAAAVISLNAILSENDKSQFIDVIIGLSEKEDPNKSLEGAFACQRLVLFLQVLARVMDDGQAARAYTALTNLVRGIKTEDLNGDDRTFKETLRSDLAKTRRLIAIAHNIGFPDQTGSVSAQKVAAILPGVAAVNDKHKLEPKFVSEELKQLSEEGQKTFNLLIKSYREACEEYNFGEDCTMCQKKILADLISISKRIATDDPNSARALMLAYVNTLIIYDELIGIMVPAQYNNVKLDLLKSLRNYPDKFVNSLQTPDGRMWLSGKLKGIISNIKKGDKDTLNSLSNKSGEEIVAYVLKFKVPHP